jgi:hypothetical protein
MRVIRPYTPDAALGEAGLADPGPTNSAPLVPNGVTPASF